MSKNQNFYKKLVEKFNKFSAYIRRIMEEGIFQKMTTEKQTSLLYKLQQLFNRVTNLQKNLGIKVAGTALALTLMTTGINAQDFTFTLDADNNPLEYTEDYVGSIFREMRPMAIDFVDIDNDGDLDLFYGTTAQDTQTPNMIYYKNNGTNANPVWEFQDFDQNPFGDEYYGIHPNPEFIDWDNDGDFDMFTNTTSDEPNGRYFENIGNANNPEFIERTSNHNPINDIGNPDDNDYMPSLGFIDYDGDGDLDLFAAFKQTDLKYYENQSGTLVEQTDTHFDDNFVGEMPDIEFVDIDNDGDQDCFIATSFPEGTTTPLGLSIIEFYEQNDDNEFILQETENNPLGELIFDFQHSDMQTDYSLSLEFEDFDADGDQDAFVTTNYGLILYYENQGDANTPNFVHIENNAMISEAIPTFTDWNNDGLTDCFLFQQTNGMSKYFLNEGTAETPFFTSIYGYDNPMQKLNFGGFTQPTWFDEENDNIPECFFGYPEVSNEDDVLMYNWQEGLGFMQREFSTKTPLSRYNIMYFNDNQDIRMGNAAVTFADMDNDGDKDAFIGELDGTLNYFRHDGRANNEYYETIDYQFIEGAENPFPTEITGNLATPKLKDFDADGDNDLFIYFTDDDENYFYKYYQNIGTPEEAEFVELYDSETNPGPFQDAFANHENPTPNFTDIDNDGDVDMFVGDSDGHVHYYYNEIFYNFATQTIATDIADNHNGSDMQVNFNKAYDETNINEYRIIVVKEENSATFDLATAEVVQNNNYTAVTPEGTEIYTTILSETATDNKGDLIVEDQPYNVFILNMKTENYLSEMSETITLTSENNISSIGENIFIYNNNKFIYIENVKINNIVSIYDLTGKLILTNKLLSGKNELFLNAETGIYFIKVQTKNQIINKKIIIQ